MKMEDQTRYNLISKHLSGETSEQEDQQLWEWIDENPAHFELFQQLVETYAGKSQWTPNLPEEIKDLTIPKVKEKRVWTKNVWRIAATVVFGTSIVIYLYLSTRIENTEIQTRAGEMKEITLPDSTKVWLNGSSWIRYRSKDFAQKRVVEVEGEAFFKIRKTGQLTFKIIYDSVELVAQGGEFNVENFKNKKEKTVTISEGSASFYDRRKNGLTIQAETGQEVVSVDDYGILSIEVSANINFDSWITGRYAFDQTPVSVVIELAAKDQGISISIPEKELRQQTISEIFENFNSKKLMGQLLVKLNARIEKKDRNLYLVRNKNS
ncbi:anti-sigma factor [Cytophagales bacterium WSM2-2]|nr:anti-sigma factor [Cytophagales bacterium WSM2-2]